MKRLTADNNDGTAHYPYCFRDNTCGGMGEGNCGTCGFSQQVCERLAAYERTGLTPEEVLMALQINKNLVEQLERRWIPVTERLPYEKKTVESELDVTEEDSYVIQGDDKGVTKSVEDVLRKLELAKGLNNTENIAYGFDCQTITDILDCLSDCKNRELIDTLLRAKNSLESYLKENPDQGNNVSRIRLHDSLIERLIGELS